MVWVAVVLLIGVIEPPEPPVPAPLSPRVIVVVIPAAEREPPPRVAPPPVDLTLATAAYVGGIAGGWAASSSACVERLCSTITPTLPTVGDPYVAIPLGVAIQGTVLWVIHQWIAPRWPRVAQAALYGLGTMHLVKAADFVMTSRRRAKGLPP